MNAEEVHGLLRGAVKVYGDADQRRPSESAVEATLRQSANIRDLIDQLARFVAPAALRDACLLYAERLMAMGQHRAALHACLTPYATSLARTAEYEKAQAAKPDAVVQTKTDTERLVELAQSVRQDYLRAVCLFRTVLEADRRVEARSTVEALVRECEAIAQAMKRLFGDDEALYYLIQAGTVHLAECSFELMDAGCRKQAAVFLGWCAAALDSTLKLCSVRHLPWRVRIYSALCACYESVEQYAGALTIAQKCQAKVDDLIQLEHMDVVPPSPDQEAAMAAQRRVARILVTKYSALSAATASNSEQPDAAAGGKAGGAGGKGGQKAAAGGKGVPAAADAPSTTVAGDFAPPSTAVTSPQDVLERAKLAVSPVDVENAPRETMVALLTFAGGADQRLSAIGGMPQSVSAARAQFNAFAAEALSLLLVQPLAAFINSRAAFLPGDMPTLDAAVAASEDAAKSANAPNAAGAQKGGNAAAGGKGGKGGKAAPAAPAKNDPPTPADVAVAAEKSPSLHTWCSPEQLGFVSRHLALAAAAPGATPARTTDVLGVIPAVVREMGRMAAEEDSTIVAVGTRDDGAAGHTYAPPTGVTMKIDAPVPPSADDAALLSRLASGMVEIAVRSNGYTPPKVPTPTLENIFEAPAPDPFIASCKAVCDALSAAVTANSSFLRRNRDSVEDAALALVSLWDRAIDVPHEHPLTPLIYGTAVRGLYAADHDDVLRIGSLALVAAARLEEESRFRDSVVLVKQAEAALAARQLAFCVSHMHEKAGAIDAKAEELVTKHAVTTQGGVWLQSVRDMRTKLRASFARLRLKMCRDDKAAAIRAEHDDRVRVLQDRVTKTHIFGRLSLKEQRAVELIGETADMPAHISPDNMERKLIAHAASDPIAEALVHIEASNFQASAQKRRRHLKEALTALERADRSEDELHKALLSGSYRAAAASKRVSAAASAAQMPRKSTRGAGGLAEESKPALPVEITGTCFSVLVAWCMVAAAAARDKEYDLIVDAVYPRLQPLFVEAGDSTQRVWDANPAAWDTLRSDVVATASSLMVQCLSDAFLALASARLSAIPAGAPYHDDAVRGPDANRFTLAERQAAGLRAANAGLHALDTALAVKDEGKLVAAAHATFNGMSFMLEGGSLSPLALRPCIAILHALKTGLAPRRWSDAPLQLLGARTVEALLAASAALPEAQQGAIVAHAASAFTHFWSMVMAEPNTRQQTHIRHASADLDYIKRVLQSLKIESAADAAAAAAAAAQVETKGKGKKGAGAAAAQPQQSATPKSSTVFLRQSLLTGDAVPLEYLELFDAFCFRPGIAVHGLPVLSAAAATANSAGSSSEADTTEQFPSAQLAIAELLLKPVSPALTTKLTELKVSIYYPKLAAMAAASMLRSREIEMAVAVVDEAVAEVRARHLNITSMEQEHMSAVLANAVREAEQLEQQAASGGPLSPQARSQHVLSRRIALIRRQVAFAKLRTLERQFDIPWHARLHEVKAVALFLMQAKAAAAPPPPVAPTAPEAGAKKAAAGKGAKKDDGAKATPRGGKGGAPATAEGTTDAPEPELPLAEKLKVEAIQAGTRAVVLFGRCHRWRCMMAALHGVINMARVFYGAIPPSALTDVLTLGQRSKGLNLGDVASTIGSTATSPTPMPDFDLNDAPTEGFARIEQEMKVLCSEIIDLVERVNNGTARPDVELEYMHAQAIKTGRDCEVFGQLLARTTSLHMLLSPEGRRVANEYHSKEMQAVDRYAKIFLRERREFEETEIAARGEVENEWEQSFWELTEDPRGDHSDRESAVTTGASSMNSARKRNTSMHVTKRNKRKTGSAEARRLGASYQAHDPDEISPLDERLVAPLSAEALGRLFIFASNCMQYNRLKLSAIYLALEFNGKTRGRFATRILPYIINLQYATSQNHANTLKAYEESSRDEVRAVKLTNAAKRAWADYQLSDAYKRAIARSSSSLMPAKRAAMGFAPGIASDAMSVTTATTVGAGGPSAYKEVVQHYHAAIAMLREKQSLEELIPLLVELGDIHLLHRNRSEAERSWSDAVDATLGRVNVVNTWRSVLDSSGPAVVAKCGYRKMLVACGALANLAMYVYAEDQRKSLDACLLIAVLLWRAMSTSLAAPQRLWDAPTTGAMLRTVMPGLPLDAVDGILAPQLGNGLLYVLQQLEKHGFYAQTCTVANALELMARHSLRSLDLVVEARCYRARAAAGAGRFSAAFCDLATLLRGRSLPDTGLGHFDIVYDASEKDAVRASTAPGGPGSPVAKGAAGRGAAAKGGAADKKGAAATGAAGGDNNAIGDDSLLPIFDDSKPPMDEGNQACVEAVLGLLSNGGVSVNDAVAALYGSANTRAVVFAAATVLARLGSYDEVLPLAAAAAVDDAAALASAQDNAGKGGKGGGKPSGGKGDAKQGSADGAGASGNACAAAILAAEKIVRNALQNVRVGPGTSATPDGVRVASASSTTRPQAAGVEDHAYAFQLTSLAANLRYTAGAFTACVSKCNEALALQSNVAESVLHDQTLLNVPSFLYAVDSAAVARVHIVASDAYLRLGRAEAAMHAARHAVSAADAVNDEYTARLALRKLADGQLRAGLTESALARRAEAAVSASRLEYKGIDACWSTEVAACAAEWNRLVCLPILGSDQDALEEAFSPTRAAAANAHVPSASQQQLPAAVDSMALTLHHHGANAALQTTGASEAVAAVREGNFALSNSYTRDMAAAGILYASNVLLTGDVASAQATLRRVLAVADQSRDATAYPHFTAWAKVLLATTLRLEAGGAAVSVTRVGTAERDAAAAALLAAKGGSSATAAAADASADGGVASEGAPTYSLSAPLQERLDLLDAAMTATVRRGAHDYELLRQALLEAFAVHAINGTAEGQQRALAALLAASKVAQQQVAVARNTTATLSQWDAVIPEGTDLPQSILDALEDVARRQHQSQAAFAQVNAGHAAALNNGNVPATLSAALNPPKVTLAHAVQLFAALLGQLATSAPVRSRAVEAQASTLRELLQQLVPSAVCDAPPQANAQPPAAAWKRSHLVVSQSLVSDATHLPTIIVNHDEQRVPPHVTICVGLWPNDSTEGEDKAADEKAAKPAAKKGGKGAAAAAEVAPAADAKVAVPPNPLTIGAWQLAQTTAQFVHREAAAVHRELVAVADGPASLETALGEGPAEGKAAGGKGEAKGAKGAAPKGGAKDAAKGGDADADAGAPVDPTEAEMAAKVARRRAAAEERKGALMMAFVEGLVSARLPAGFTAKDVRPLYPNFALSAQHMKNLSALTDPASGVEVQGDADFCGWLVQISNALEAIERRRKRQKGGQGAAAA